MDQGKEVRVSDLFKITVFHGVLAFFSALSVLKMFQVYLNLGLFGLTQYLADALDEALDNLSIVVDLVFRFFSWAFDFEISLEPIWKYVLVLLMLKIAVDVRVDVKNRRYAFALLEFILGFIVSSFFALLAGITVSSDNGLLLLTWCVTGLTAYEAIKGFIAAGLYRKFQPRYWSRVVYRQKHYTLVILVAGVPAFLALFALLYFSVRGAGVISIALYILLVGAASFLDAAYEATNAPRGERLLRFLTLERRYLGVVIAYTYVFVLAELVF